MSRTNPHVHSIPAGAPLGKEIESIRTSANTWAQSGLHITRVEDSGLCSEDFSNI